MKSYSKILTLILAFIPGFCFAATPECPPTLFEKVIALSPIIIYLFITSSVFLKLKKEDVSLKQLLLDKDMWVTIKEKEVEQTEADAKKLKEATDAARLAVDNNQGEQANRTFANLTSMAATATQTRSVGAPTETEQQSVSRLLAFISGLV
ncbi:hypothetical protein ACFQ1A_29380, partial [Massilia pinisoli]|uniref:hypothetical protein n=1 Tax=Massilia pinisoli TaxID=1772194 RepID=UPI003642A47E